jgi:hypothetical protein
VVRTQPGGLRKGQDGIRDLPEATLRDGPGLSGREPRGHVRVARKFDVKALEPPTCAEQERRSLAAQPRGPCDVASN